MTTKSFGPKNLDCWTYWEVAGEGYEAGFVFKGKTLFVGNFIHRKEASEWYKKMNTEITKFSKTYTFGPKFPVSFFKKFITNHLYSSYYTYLDKKFTSYRNQYSKAVTQHQKKYKTLTKEWAPQERAAFYKAA